MRLGSVAAVALLLIGGLGHVPVALLLGLLLAIEEIAHEVWRRRGLSRLDFSRSFARDRVGWGEPIDLIVEVWNRTGLPLSWLQAEDDASPGLIRVGDRRPALRDQPGTLTNAWSLAASERVRRVIRLEADRRGVYALGPVRLASGDLFARPTGSDERRIIDRLLVRPRVLPSPPLPRPDRWGELDRARTGLSEDPSRFAGIRPFVPGDSLRRIHPRASARLGTPMSKRFEPSRERSVLIALDVETGRPSWETAEDPDQVESLYVVAASLAARLERERAAFGMIAAGYALSRRRIAEVPVSDLPGQAGRVLDLLARLQTIPSAPYEYLLRDVARHVTPNSVVVALTLRDPTPVLPSLHRIARRGAEVLVVASGEGALARAAVARRAGFGATTAVLDGPWRTASAVLVA